MAPGYLWLTYRYSSFATWTARVGLPVPSSGGARRADEAPCFCRKSTDVPILRGLEAFSRHECLEKASSFFAQMRGTWVEVPRSPLFTFLVPPCTSPLWLLTLLESSPFYSLGPAGPCGRGDRPCLHNK